MNAPAITVRPDLRTLYALFPPGDDIPEYEYVLPDEVPAPYQGLLVHEHHMTVTVERYHGDLVNVQVLARRHTKDAYARKILLTLQGSGKVVPFGVMGIHL